MKHYFDPVNHHRLHRAGSGVGGSDREEAERHQLRNLHLPVGGRPCVASDCADGADKLIFDKETHRIIGATIVGTSGAASCWVKSVWLSRWAATRKTSR